MVSVKWMGSLFSVYIYFLCILSHGCFFYPVKNISLFISINKKLEKTYIVCDGSYLDVVRECNSMNMMLI